MITLTREEAQQVLEDIEAIAKADYRHWEELASLGEFERWARSRANHIAITLRARLAEPEKEQEPTRSEKLREAGVTRRPKGWSKDGDEQKPVAWRTFDGEGGYDYRDYELNEDYGHWWEERHPNHKNWVDPLYTAPPQQQNQFNPDWDAMAVMVEEQQRMAKRIEELEAALKEQEPVAWADKYDMDREGHDFWVSRQRPAKYGVPLYAAPFSTPDSAAHSADSAGTFCRREWVGLTDEEIEKLFIWQEWSEDFAEYEPVARAIEAKLKEKNNL